MLGLFGHRKKAPPIYSEPKEGSVMTLKDGPHLWVDGKWNPPVHIHEWGKWTLIKSQEGNYSRWGRTYKRTILMLQERVCLTCHKIELDTQEIPFGGLDE